ncbi:MAG: hypothetical protein Q9M36_05450 [Sulfurovum sp.]|nr:hypothetical protein [Sulfurovum sp.]
MSNPIFSAKEPSLGYLYQIQYGLLLLLTSKQENNAKILIEALDDIELQTEDETKLYQTKYHKKKDTNLTDRSSDFWKTIRVWSEQILDKTVDIKSTRFTLITTVNISDDSIILKIKNKRVKLIRVEDILNKLNIITNEAGNDTNKKGYIAFQRLSPSQQKELIPKIYIIDSSFDFKDIEQKIQNELKIFVEPNKIIPMFERLSGWFLNNSILHLQSKKDFYYFRRIIRRNLFYFRNF